MQRDQGMMQRIKNNPHYSALLQRIGDIASDMPPRSIANCLWGLASECTE